MSKMDATSYALRIAFAAAAFSDGQNVEKGLENHGDGSEQGSHPVTCAFVRIWSDAISEWRYIRLALVKQTKAAGD